MSVCHVVQSRIYQDVIVQDEHDSEGNPFHVFKHGLGWPLFYGSMAVTVWVYRGEGKVEEGDEPIYAASALCSTYYDYPYGLSPFKPIFDI